MNLLDLAVKIGVDDQASDKVESIGSGITAKLGNAVKDVGKMVATATAAAAAAAGAGVVAMTKAALDGYSSYEQLVGGVDKLYGDASGKLQQYAQQAYKTSGMSANQYMEQATSFSAALINSLGGDVDKAADQTDKAMRLMSDNVNTFGTDAEAVQNAIQGLSRENFTMIDNLKLGYSGTKEGMQQLIADANEYAGLVGTENELTIDSFSDMIDAIDIIQQKQNIWGTTAKEAATTIEGSVNMTKAAWQNFLTAIGSGDQELIQNSINGIVDGIFGTFNEEVGKREGGVIANVLPVIQNVFQALQDTLPDLMSQLLEAAVTYLNDTFGTSFDIDTINSVIAGLSEALSIVADVILTVADAVLMLMDALGPFLPAIIAGVAAFVAMNSILSAVGAAVTFFTTVVIPAVSAIGSFGGAISALVTLLGGPIPIIAAVIAAIVMFIATNEDARNAINAAWEAIKSAVFTAIRAVRTIVSEAWNAIKQWTSETWETIKTTVSNVFDAIASFVSTAMSTIGGTISSIWSTIQTTVSTAVQNVQSAVSNGFANVVSFVSNIPNSILNALGNLGTLLWNAGSSIIDGLWNGMMSAAGGLFDWVGTIAGTIASLKGPLPYDKKVLVENGLALMGGLRGGMQKGFEEDVLPYVKGMASDISGNMSFSAVNSGAAMGSAPQFSLYIDKLTVRNRDDADYFAEQINDIWRQQIEGSLA